MTKKCLLLFWTFLIAVAKTANGTVTVAKVPAGHLAELPCSSNDAHHRFMFWQLKDDSQIIGPGNPLDENKYNYEVLTGKLFIRGVSTAESGFYKCVSKGIKDISAIKVHVVELIVRKDWEDDSGSSYETHLIQAMAVITALVVAIAIILYIVVSKKRNNRFFEIDESRENSPAKYSENVRPISATSPIPTSIPTTAGGVDNPSLDVDFPKVFQYMQNQQIP